MTDTKLRFDRTPEGLWLRNDGVRAFEQNDDGTYSVAEPLRPPSQTVDFWRKVATSWAGVALWLAIALYFTASGFLCFVALLCAVGAGVGFVMGLSSIVLTSDELKRDRR